MLGAEVGWWVCIVLIVLLGGAAFFRRGPYFALAVSVPIAFLVPVWLEISVAGIPFSVQTSIAAIFLLAFVVRSPWEIRSPIVLLDVIVASLVVLQICSDTYHGQNAVQAGLLGYGEWALPYVAGRFAFRDSRNIEPVALLLTGIVLILGAGSAIESVTKINPWELVFGERPLDGFPRDASRFGFKRAYGTTLHPIFFGLLILVLLPWAVSLLKWAQNGAQRSLAVVGVIVGTLGILGAGSRAPILGLAIFYLVVALIWWKASRWILAAFAVAALVWVTIDFNGMLATIETMGGEKRSRSHIVLDGQRIESSSAHARVVAWQVFWPALKEAGALGYGSEATSVLPPRVPHLPKNKTDRHHLRFVDNAYLMFGLRFGWTGMILYCLLLLTATWTGFWLSRDRSIGVLAGGIMAMTVALALNMVTVWFSYDMGFEALWSFGVLAGLASHLES